MIILRYKLLKLRDLKIPFLCIKKGFYFKFVNYFCHKVLRNVEFLLYLKFYYFLRFILIKLVFQVGGYREARIP